MYKQNGSYYQINWTVYLLISILLCEKTQRLKKLFSSGFITVYLLVYL